MQDVSSAHLNASRVLRVDMLDSYARIVTAISKPLPLCTCARCAPGGGHCQLLKLPLSCSHMQTQMVFSFR
ncbi:hypothetical protein KIN20_020160 [Parelaphostrongylus tenuis]|uniref:Uncharacterized protein n=1 Tax=Parelaphostrongylus tenuis TaxID=148309 RepID=A0AAD5QTG6_PARTN|nr:hypothetical protein KIN20_020160 [Parelaphostrongylus tenuis]